MNFSIKIKVEIYLARYHVNVLKNPWSRPSVTLMNETKIVFVPLVMNILTKGKVYLWRCSIDILTKDSLEFMCWNICNMTERYFSFFYFGLFIESGLTSMFFWWGASAMLHPNLTETCNT